MNNLTNDDLKYLDNKFNTIHTRIGDTCDDIAQINRDISAIKIEAEKRLTAIETEHKVQRESTDSKKKNIFNILSIAGAYIAIGVMFIL